MAQQPPGTRESDPPSHRRLEPQRRRLLGAGMAWIALGALPGCGGGGSGSPSPAPGGSPSPSPSPAAGPRGGVFGGGQGRIAWHSERHTLSLMSLATRQVLASFDLGIDVSYVYWGIMANAQGTMAHMTDRFASSSELIVRIFDADLALLHRHDISMGLGSASSPASVSPDGSRFGFGFWNTAGQGGSGLYVANLDNTDVRRLRIGSSDTSDTPKLLWLPDGRVLVVTRQRFYTSDAALTTLTPLIDVALTGADRLVLDRSATTLYFSQSEAGGSLTRIWSLDLATGIARQRATGYYMQWPAAVSPDGEWLLFDALRDFQVANGSTTGVLEHYLSAVPMAELGDTVLDVSNRYEQSVLDAAGAGSTLEGGVAAWF